MKTPAPIRLIVGLGNPGPQYAGTRHNAGQDVVERIAREHNASLSSNPKFFGFTGTVSLNNTDLRLLVPTTFMNRSGQAIAAFSQFYKIPTQSILVVHDELDLAAGVARLKFGGGHGGHNGLRDTISALANDANFARLRIGIGHPGHASAVAAYVLKKAPSAEQQTVADSIDTAIDILPKLVTGDWEAAMRDLHTRSK